MTSSNTQISRVSEDCVGQLNRIDVPIETISYFKEHAQWTDQLLSNPNKYIPVLIPYRVPLNTTGNGLFRTVLPPAITHHVVLYHDGPSSFPHNVSLPTSKYGTIFALYALSSLANGYADTAHGGLISALFDELLGMCIGCDKDTFAFTLETKVGYKKRLITPTVVLGRARIVREKGRKMWITGELVNERGEVYAAADSLWIASRDGMARL
jgi:acyl-coenzyme A thioesterase PaaI-like protein